MRAFVSFRSIKASASFMGGRVWGSVVQFEVGRERVSLLVTDQDLVERGDFSGREVALPAFRMIDREACAQGRGREPDNWLSVGAAAGANPQLTRSVDREFDRKEVGDVEMLESLRFALLDDVHGRL